MIGSRRGPPTKGVASVSDSGERNKRPYRIVKRLKFSSEGAEDVINACCRLGISPSPPKMLPVGVFQIQLATMLEGLVCCL